MVRKYVYQAAHRPIQTRSLIPRKQQLLPNFWCILSEIVQVKEHKYLI